MKINRLGIIGFITGYFVVSPIVIYPNFPISFLDLLIRTIIGLVIAIFMGIFLGYSIGEN